jgi:hypothetical protein
LASEAKGRAFKSRRARHLSKWGRRDLLLHSWSGNNPSDPDGHDPDGQEKITPTPRVV